MDIKAMVEELVKEIQKTPKLLAQFKENPVPVIEKLVGMFISDVDPDGADIDINKTQE